jgi:Phosphodiester glycosidase
MRRSPRYRRFLGGVADWPQVTPLGSVWSSMFNGGLRWRGLIGLVLALPLAGLMGPASPFAIGCVPPPDPEIFVGIAYGCAVLRPTAEGQGALHWVTVDLAAPGIELYVTPLDPTAVSHGSEYRLRWIDDVVDRERLAVAINGTLFTSTPEWRPRLAGDLARGVETIVSNHAVNHLWQHTYLLWFDDQLAPHLRPVKPPSASELRAAKWAIGGQGVGLHDGKVWDGSDRKPDSRTGIGIDPQGNRLFLLVADWISPHLLLEELAKLGARDGMLLDGGGSSAIAIGEGARGLSPGVLIGGWRPVATYFGVRAQHVPSSEH